MIHQIPISHTILDGGEYVGPISINKAETNRVIQNQHGS